MTDPTEIPRVAVSTTPPAPPPRRAAGPVLTALGLVLLVVAIGFVWTQVQEVAGSVVQLEMTVHRLIDAQAREQAGAVRGIEARLVAIDLRMRKLELEQAAPPVRLVPLVAQPATQDADIAGLQQRLASVEQVLATAGIAQDATRALGAGQPLGVIRGAPPALARYAEARPPTEAGLRREFPSLAARATEASKPATEADGVAQRMWLHVQSLVTVKDHDKVLVGAPAAIILGEAQDRLTTGDLAGAVAALAALDPAAAAIMADWSARAQALLDARAAVTALTGVH